MNTYFKKALQGLCLLLFLQQCSATNLQQPPQAQPSSAPTHQTSTGLLRKLAKGCFWGGMTYAALSGAQPASAASNGTSFSNGNFSAAMYELIEAMTLPENDTNTSTPGVSVLPLNCTEDCEYFATIYGPSDHVATLKDWDLVFATFLLTGTVALVGSICCEQAPKRMPKQIKALYQADRLQSREVSEVDENPNFTTKTAKPVVS